MDIVSTEMQRSNDLLRVATGLAKEIGFMVKPKKADSSFLNDIELCVSEACTNAIKYSSGKSVVICFKIFKKKLRIEIKDQGEGFDLENVSEPDFESHPEGGYGVFIIKSKMDSVEYKIGKHWNMFVMTKLF
jgi:serine/threonine-protein kinase RsbW